MSFKLTGVIQDAALDALKALPVPPPPVGAHHYSAPMLGTGRDGVAAVRATALAPAGDLSYFLEVISRRHSLLPGRPSSAPAFRGSRRASRRR